MLTIIFEDGNNPGVVYRGTQKHFLGLAINGGGVPSRVPDSRLTPDGKAHVAVTDDAGKQTGWDTVDIVDALEHWAEIETPCKGMEVVVKTERWEEYKGVIEDKIPNSNWWNVRVAPDFRLALLESEFQIL